MIQLHPPLVTQPTNQPNKWINKWVLCKQHGGGNCWLHYLCTQTHTHTHLRILEFKQQIQILPSQHLYDRGVTNCAEVYSLEPEGKCSQFLGSLGCYHVEDITSEEVDFTFFCSRQMCKTANSLVCATTANTHPESPAALANLQLWNGRLPSSQKLQLGTSACQQRRKHLHGKQHCPHRYISIRCAVHNQNIPPPSAGFATHLCVFVCVWQADWAFWKLFHSDGSCLWTRCGQWFSCSFWK